MHSSRLIRRSEVQLVEFITGFQERRLNGAHVKDTICQQIAAPLLSLLRSLSGFVFNFIFERRRQSSTQDFLRSRRDFRSSFLRFARAAPRVDEKVSPAHSDDALPETLRARSRLAHSSPRAPDI